VFLTAPRYLCDQALPYVYSLDTRPGRGCSSTNQHAAAALRAVAFAGRSMISDLGLSGTGHFVQLPHGTSIDRLGLAWRECGLQGGALPHTAGTGQGPTGAATAFLFIFPG